MKPRLITLVLTSATALACIVTAGPSGATTPPTYKPGAPRYYAYNAGHGNKIYAYWKHQEKNVPWAIAVPGGYWRHGDGDGPTLIEWAKHERSRGIAAFLVDYRTVNDGFGWAEEKHDVERAIGWVRGHYGTFGLNPKEGFIIGGSSGAAMSDVAALDDGRLAGAMSFGGAADIYDAAFDPAQKNPKLPPAAKALHHNVMPWKNYKTWSDSRPKNHIKKSKPIAFLLVHSIHDHTVNIKMSDDLARHLAAAKYPVTEKRIPGNTHSFGSKAWHFEDAFMAARIAAIQKPKPKPKITAP